MVVSVAKPRRGTLCPRLSPGHVLHCVVTAAGCEGCMELKKPMPGHSARRCVLGYFCFCGSEVAGEAKPSRWEREPRGTLNDAFKKSMLLFFFPLPFPSPRKSVKQNMWTETNTLQWISPVIFQAWFPAIIRGSQSLLPWNGEGAVITPSGAHNWPWPRQTSGLQTSVIMRPCWSLFFGCSPVYLQWYA